MLAVAASVSVALGCSTGNLTTAVVEQGAAPPLPALEKQDTGLRTFRLGFWEIDLLALDREPRGTTFRFLDFKILKALEIGSGADYHSFSLVEMPDLLNIVTTRHEGPVSEHRFVDLQALALAAMRLVKKSEREAETQVLKIPLLGSLYGHEIDGATEEHTVLYLYRRENER
jgi:hypothetical protein